MTRRLSEIHLPFSKRRFNITDDVELNGPDKGARINLIKVLRNKSGFSLIFVLASMLLLLAIGVSAVTAAGYNHGAGLAQRDRNQLEMYVSSMERTIHSALMQDITGMSVVGTNTLRGMVLRDAYREKENHEIDTYNYCYYKYAETYDLDVEIPDDINVFYTIRVEVDINVQIYLHLEKYEWDDLAEDTVLSEYSTEHVQMDGTVKVYLTTVDNEPLMQNRRSSTSTITTYYFTGVIILEQNDSFDISFNLNNMIIDDPGNWKVDKHEKTGA